MDEIIDEKINEKMRSSLLHRNVLGFLGMILPFLSIIGGLFVADKPDTWWYSISVTYYLTPALPIVLGSCAIFLLCYRSYEKIDTIINTLSGVFALLVVLFPCDNPYNLTRVGFFQIPIAISNVIHCVSAVTLFLLFAINVGCLFTKGKSKKRNVIYKVCAIIILCGMLVIFGVNIYTSINPNGPGWIVMIGEAVLLIAFGIAWLTKGRAIFKNLD